MPIAKIQVRALLPLAFTECLQAAAERKWSDRGRGKRLQVYRRGCVVKSQVTGSGSKNRLRLRDRENTYATHRSKGNERLPEGRDAESVREELWCVLAFHLL